MHAPHTQTDEEYGAMLAGHSYPDYDSSPHVQTFTTSEADLSSHDFPSAIDWRTKGVVTSVKNQVTHTHTYIKHTDTFT